ncbi:hypothetical protein HY78_29010 (plasmid) [Rhizorhabdus wittichii DC-6]|nr:hypothetical protein HY78_29010 [Rhizorhabdus wittichii DC-6]
MAKTKVAIIGSGNIGTDLMIKIMRLSKTLEMGAFVGSGLIGHSQKMTVAASAMAEKKAVGHRS